MIDHFLNKRKNAVHQLVGDFPRIFIAKNPVGIGFAAIMPMLWISDRCIKKPMVQHRFFVIEGFDSLLIGYTLIKLKQCVIFPFHKTGYIR